MGKIEIVLKVSIINHMPCKSQLSTRGPLSIERFREDEIFFSSFIFDQNGNTSRNFLWSKMSHYIYQSFKNKVTH